MDERSSIDVNELSPYRHFKRSEWAALRADTPLTLTVEDLDKLQSMNDPISVEEVIAIYLPLSRLLALYVAATQGLFKATQRFLGAEDGKVPYIIGIAGSVAVGKSTTARVLQAGTIRTGDAVTRADRHPFARICSVCANARWSSHAAVREIRCSNK